MFAPGHAGPHEKSPTAPLCRAGQGIFFFSPAPCPVPGAALPGPCFCGFRGPVFAFPHQIPVPGPCYFESISRWKREFPAYVYRLTYTGNSHFPAKLTHNSGGPGIGWGPAKKAGHRKYPQGPVAVHRARPLIWSPARCGAGPGLNYMPRPLVRCGAWHEILAPPRPEANTIYSTIV